LLSQGHTQTLLVWVTLKNLKKVKLEVDDARH
jgi:hypothetical protein